MSVDAIISPNVGVIGPHADIAAGVIIKRDTTLGAVEIGEGAIIGRGVRIGEGVIGEDAVLRRHRRELGAWA